MENSFKFPFLRIISKEDCIRKLLCLADILESNKASICRQIYVQRNCKWMV